MHSSRKYLAKSAMALQFNTLRIVPLIISELLWSTFSPSEPSASWSLHSNEVLEYAYSRRIGCEMRTTAFPSPLTWSHMSLVRERYWPWKIWVRGHPSPSQCLITLLRNKMPNKRARKIFVTHVTHTPEYPGTRCLGSRLVFPGYQIERSVFELSRTESNSYLSIKFAIKFDLVQSSNEIELTKINKYANQITILTEMLNYYNVSLQ